MTSRFERLATYGILIAASVFALYPMVLILFTALQPDSVGGSGGFHFENFATAWRVGQFGTYMSNSIVVAAIVVTVSAILSSLAGYAFGTMKFRGSGAFFYLLLLGLMVPSEAIVIPLYYDLRGLGLTDTYFALIFPQIAQSLAFGVFWMRQYFRSVPPEIIEAARVDGASHLRVFWSVLLPMGRPAITTMVLLVLMWTWNEFLLPLIMLPTNEGLRTAPLGLSFFKGQYTEGTALLAAGAVLVALPIVVFYIFAQRHFIRGMLEGSLKG